MSCNPFGHEIKSKRSCIFASNYNYSPALRIEGFGQTELFLPREGYVDGYTVDYVLRQMREKLNQKKKAKNNSFDIA